MSDREPPGAAPQDPPAYTRYRSRPRGLLARLRGEDDLAELRRLEAADASGGGRRAGGRRPESGPADAPGRGRGPWTWKRVLLVLAGLAVGWLALSFLLFLISAQIEQGKISDRDRATLSGSGFPLFSAQTILVLGTDKRPKNSKEPGANQGPSRSDSIMLVRVGGGASARLSVPRDTLVSIPGHGTQKINAAFAFGGAGLTVRTVEALLPGVKVNHLIIVDFTNFPKLIDALGGIDIRTSCVFSKINGGYKNGGVTLRLHHGDHHLTGKQALALARTRHNDCAPRENDLARARRQQKILAAMKGSALSFGTFFRLPWVAWDAPQALRSDMGGLSLLGVLGGLATGGDSGTAVLKPSGGATLPDGEQGLVVSPQSAAAAARRFMHG